MDIILYLAAIVVALVSQAKVKGAYAKYRKVPSASGMTGEQVARRILDNNGLYNVNIELSSGVLSDHYDPSNHVVRLSNEIYRGSSIAAISVAAHEVGHAIQHSEQYGFIAIRNTILPMTQISSNLAWPILMIGLFLSSGFLIYIGILLLIVVMVFQIVTLPVEFNASSRALIQLENEGIIYSDERSKCKSMLSAAAMTYVAAVVASALQILRLLLIASRRD